MTDNNNNGHHSQHGDLFDTMEIDNNFEKVVLFIYLFSIHKILFKN
jgi:hypothetical protein